MREQPPQQLIDLLEQLGLVTADEVRAMDRRVRRLARGLPRFESVWVDALAQSRLLTPFQAAQINSGRGRSLRLGPYVLCGRLPGPSFAACYQARQIETDRVVRLAVVALGPVDAEQMLGQLLELVESSRSLQSECLAPIVAAGSCSGANGEGDDRDCLWAACRDVEGRTAAEWMVENGRFPPEVVLEIARQMLPGLAALEETGLCHSDIGAAGLLLTGGGRVVLPHPGLRAVVRPREGYAHTELAPEAYDYLAPERISEAAPPGTMADVYACGCLWWHLLSGRPPVPGGSSLGKLRTAQIEPIPDVRRLAPETPGTLAAAVSACAERRPDRRPDSMARLMAMLGPPTRTGRLALARSLAGRPRRRVSRVVSLRSNKRAMGRRKDRSSWKRLGMAAIATCLALAAAVICAERYAGSPIRPARIPTAGQTANRAAPSEAGLRGQAPSEDPDGLAKAKAGGPNASTAGPDPLAEPHFAAATSATTAPGANAGELVLASGGPLSIDPIELKAGWRVRGRPGSRPLLAVPYGGLLVGVENVHFENIDFLWNHAKGDKPAGSQPAVVHLSASRAEFSGCSFQSAGSTQLPPAAIRWTHPANRDEAELSLPSGRVGLSDCLFRGVDAGIDCRTAGALAVGIANTLHLGAGPLVRLDHAPRPDEPLAIELSWVTLRGTGPLLECRYRQIEGQPGRISIRATDCVLAPREQAALLAFAGDDPPGPLLESIQWTGQGSLVVPEVVIAQWQPSHGRNKTLDDASLSIAGLVRSKVQFAGNAESDPASSRVVRWQAPLRSSGPPGIDPQRICPAEQTAVPQK